VGENSQWINSESLVVGASGEATLNVLHGGVVIAAGGLTISAKGLMAGDGTVAAEVVNHGHVALDNSTSGLKIVGDYFQAAIGTLDVELVGASDSGLLDVLGRATLGGSLVVSTVEGFVPDLNDSFQILSSLNDLSGSFDSVAYPALAAGLMWQLNYGLNDVTLSIVPAFAGDFDFDGDVDGRDFLLWQRNPSVGDLADWQGNYGNSSLSASVAVPEPGTVVLVGIIGMVAALGRKHVL
jgi:hypothetical protein